MRRRWEAGRAEDAMSRRVRTLRADESVESAAAALRELGIGGAPVLDARGEPVGVLTLADVAGCERSGRGRAVSEWMTRGVVAVTRSAPLSEVVRRMARRHVHRVFVRDGAGGRICGVVTSFDVLRFVETMLRREARRERGRPAAIRKPRAVTAQVPLRRNRRPPPGGGRREFAPPAGGRIFSRGGLS